MELQRLVVTLLSTATISISSAAAQAGEPILKWKVDHQKISVEHADDSLLKIKGLDGLTTLKREGDRFRLGKKTIEKNQIVDENGNNLHRLESKGDDYRIYEGEKLLVRVKFKKDKADYIDPADRRTLRLKQKPDGFSLKPEGSNDTTEKIKGPLSLREASFLGLPIPNDERLLFWIAERKP